MPKLLRLEDEVITIKQYLIRLLGLESNDAQEAMPVSTMTQTENDILAPLYKEKELIQNLCSAIYECYPDIQKLDISIIPIKIYIGNGKYDDKYCLNITWENGVCECAINSVIACILADYFKCAQGHVSSSLIRPQLTRLYTAEAILQAGQKFANCISPNLPLNMHNIYCFTIGGVTIYNLALGELRLQNNV